MYVVDKLDSIITVLFLKNTLDTFILLLQDQKVLGMNGLLLLMNQLFYLETVNEHGLRFD